MTYGEGQAVSDMPAQKANFEDIGRSVDQSWLHKFEDAFLDLTGTNALDIYLRTAPGVLYAPSNELIAAYRKYIIPGEATNTERIIDDLVDRSVLDPDLTRESLEVPVFGFEAEPTINSPEILRILARVGDVVCANYSGFAVCGEKQSVVTAINPSITSFRMPMENNLPVNQFDLGIYIGNEGKIVPDILEDLNASLGGNIPLNPVGKLLL